jgi:5-methylcytosine-specific restriction protein A
MKLCNFLRFDPSYSGTGLRAGGKKEEEVWNRFADARNRLREVAEAIKLGVQSPTEGEVITREIDEEEEAPEGRVLFRQHKSRERSQSLVRKRKALALQMDGRLMCEVCGFVFEQRYGSLGEGFIEAHHTVPVSSLRPGQRTKVKDISLVCSNCHRMLHRGGETLTVSQLQQIVNPRA